MRPLINWLTLARDGSYRIEVTKVRGRRSNDQNAWLWGCIYPLLRQGMNALGWDEMTSDEEVHEYFKQLLADKKIVNRLTGETVTIPSSTAAMDTMEFSAYCEKLRDYGREYLGIEIPDPS